MFNKKGIGLAVSQEKKD